MAGQAKRDPATQRAHVRAPGRRGGIVTAIAVLGEFQGRADARPLGGRVKPGHDDFGKVAPNRTARARAGYSLLELLVVLAIIGLIATVAAPIVTTSVERMTLNADARAVATQLRALRDRALDEQKEITIAPDGAPLNVSGGTALTTVPAKIAIAPDGTLNGALVLRRGSVSVRVTMHRFTGRIHIEGAR